MEATPLIDELIQAMKRDGYAEQAQDLGQLLEKLNNGTEAERENAAETISANCHIKCYGDLNIGISGEGSYPLWNHLSKIKQALSAL